MSSSMRCCLLRCATKGGFQRHSSFIFSPLCRFDETFDLVLPQGADRSSCYVHLAVKDRGLMGEGVFLGEAFLPLAAADRSGDLGLSLQVGETKKNRHLKKVTKRTGNKYCTGK